MKLSLKFFFTLILSIFAIKSVQAQIMMPCNDYDIVLESLKNRVGENIRMIATTSDGRLVYITANNEGSSWSFLLSAPGNQLCFLATGNFIEVLKEEEQSKPEQKL